MYNKLVKYGDAIAVGLGVLCILIFVIGIVAGFSSAGYDMNTDLTSMADKSNINFFNSGLYLLMIQVDVLMLIGVKILSTLPKA